MTTVGMTLPRQDLAARSEAASYRVLYALLFTIGFALRFGMVLWRKSYFFPPAWIFENLSIATNLATGHGFSSPFNIDTGPSAWIAPAYPFFLATVFKIFGLYSAVSMRVIFGIQCMMAGGTGIAIHALAKRTVGAGIGWWAAWIWTLSPFFFRWPTTWIWDFTVSALLMAVLLILTLDVAESGSTKLWLGLGGLWGLAALTNPALISVLPFTMAYAAYVNRRAGRKWLRGLSLASVLFAAMITPWLIRNEMVFGHFVFLRGNYWFEFHLGNYHYSNGMGFSGKHPTQNSRFAVRARVSGGIFEPDHPSRVVVLGRHSANLRKRPLVEAVAVLAVVLRGLAGFAVRADAATAWMDTIGGAALHLSGAVLSFLLHE